MHSYDAENDSPFRFSIEPVDTKNEHPRSCIHSFMGSQLTPTGNKILLSLVDYIVLEHRALPRGEVVKGITQHIACLYRVRLKILGPVSVNHLFRFYTLDDASSSSAIMRLLSPGSPNKQHDYLVLPSSKSGGHRMCLRILYTASNCKRGAISHAPALAQASYA